MDAHGCMGVTFGSDCSQVFNRGDLFFPQQIWSDNKRKQKTFFLGGGNWSEWHELHVQVGCGLRRWCCYHADEAQVAKLQQQLASRADNPGVCKKNPSGDRNKWIAGEMFFFYYVGFSNTLSSAYKPFKYKRWFWTMRRMDSWKL